MQTARRICRTVRLVAILFALLQGGSIAATPHHDDPIFLDAEPPYTGPGHTGLRISPDENGKILDTFDAEGVALLSWTTLPSFPGANGRAADVWGYVSPTGREYAIIGLENGTGFVEVTDPLQPTIVGFIPGSSTIWRDMKTYDEVAYVVHDTPYEDVNGGDGLFVIDLRQIDDGIVSLAGAVTDFDLKTSHNIALNPTSGFAYLVGSNGRGPDISNGGIIAVDLNDPLHPTFTLNSVWSETYVHDVVVITYEDGPYAGREIAFAACGSQGLFIVDVTDKNNMFTMSSLVYPNTTYCHHSWISEDRQTLYVNDEVDELNDPDVTTTTTYVVDVQDLSNPTFVLSFTNGLPAIDHNPMGRDGYLFEANYRSGLRIWRIAELGSEEEVAYFDSYPNDDEPNFNGAWGVYPDLPSRSILVSDIERGLFVLSLTVTDAETSDVNLPAGLRSHPNPFRTSTHLSFVLDRPEKVTVDLYDAAGRHLATLLDRFLAPGPHDVLVDESTLPSRVTTGVGYALLRTPSQKATRRIVWLH